MRLEDELKMNFKSPHQRALLNISFTNYWLNEKFGELMKSHDLSEQQYNVLRILRGQNGNPINLQDIQSRMIHKMSNTTRLVEKLRLKGLVERVLCEENRRKVEITITEKGLELMKELDPIMVEEDKALEGNLTSEEAKLLGDLLDKFRG